MGSIVFQVVEPGKTEASQKPIPLDSLPVGETPKTNIAAILGD
jgi:hypothetical protein